MSKVSPKILSYQTKGFTMKVTLHAAERFLQRVMHKVEFSFQDILNTKQFLETAMENVVVTPDFVAGSPNFRLDDLK